VSAITNALGGLVKDFSGAGYNAGQVGDYYSQAAGNLVNATGSPAATTFGNEEAAALKPQFKQQDQTLADKEAAMGITQSGAAKADFSDLQNGQSATLAGAIAPLYQSAIGEYGNIEGQGAGAQAGAYNSSLQQFYQMLQQYTSPNGQNPPNAQIPTSSPADSNPYAGIPTPSGAAYDYGSGMG